MANQPLCPHASRFWADVQRLQLHRKCRWEHYNAALLRNRFQLGWNFLEYRRQSRQEIGQRSVFNCLSLSVNTSIFCQEQTRKDGVLHYPTHTLRLQLGIWDASNATGTSAWAKGPIDWDSAPETMTAVLRSVTVSC